MTHVISSGYAGCADPYCAPSQAASPEAYTLRRIWAEALDQWRLPASHQLHGAAVAHPLTSTAYGELLDAPYLLRPKARALLDGIATVVQAPSSALNLPDDISALRLAVLDDGSLLLEWIRSDRRLGFLLSDAEGEAGWFYVYSAGSSQLYEAGSMDQLDLARMTRAMLQ